MLFFETLCNIRIFNSVSLILKIFMHKRYYFKLIMSPRIHLLPNGKAETVPIMSH